MLNLVKSIIGELPTEYEFIYYVSLLLFILGTLSLIFTPFYALFKNLGKSR